MRRNTAVSILLLLLAVSLFALWRIGAVSNDTLNAAAAIASVIAGIAAVVVFFVPPASEGESVSTSQVAKKRPDGQASKEAAKALDLDHLLAMRSSTVAALPDGAVQISGDFYEPIYIRRVLADNFVVEFRFRLRNISDEFTIGLGPGVDWKPNIRVVFGTTGIWLKKTVSNNNALALQKVEASPIGFSKAHLVVLQRVRNLLSVFVDGVFVIRHEDESAGKFNYLFIAAHSLSGDGRGVVTIEQSDMREIVQ